MMFAVALSLHRIAHEQPVLGLEEIFRQIPETNKTGKCSFNPSSPFSFLSRIFGRSAYLVMLTGLSYMAVVCKIMVNQSEGVFGHEKNVYIAKIVSSEETLHRVA